MVLISCLDCDYCGVMGICVFFDDVEYVVELVDLIFCVVFDFFWDYGLLCYWVDFFIGDFYVFEYGLNCVGDLVELEDGVGVDGGVDFFFV